MQVRSKTFAKAQAEKEKQVVQKSPKTPRRSGHLLVFKRKKEHTPLKKDTSAVVRVQHPKPMHSVPKPADADIKPKKIFQTRMPPSRFAGMIDSFNKAQT